jgi:hypothetical protein
VSGAVRQLKRRPAKRPAPRTVTVTLDGDFEGWEATARVDFPARLLVELESGKLERIIPALDSIIIDHNFPNDQDEIAASLGDVDPYSALEKLADKVFDAIAKLPNR